MRKQRIIRRIYGMKYSWKGNRQKQTQEQNKKERASSVGLCEGCKLQHPHHVKVSLWGWTLQVLFNVWQYSASSLVSGIVLQARMRQCHFPPPSFPRYLLFEPVTFPSIYCTLLHTLVNKRLIWSEPSEAKVRGSTKECHYWFRVKNMFLILIGEYGPFS